MKKLLALILALAMSVSVFIQTDVVYADAGLTEEQDVLLKMLGIVEEDMSLDEVLTRAQFAQMLAHAAFPITEDISIYNAGKELTDVDEYYEYADAIGALYSAGITKPDNFGRFFPERKITFDEAITLVLRTLGFTDEVISNSGGARVVAQKMGLYDGVTTYGETVNAFSAYNLIYNMLYTDVSPIYEEANDAIFMNYWLNIYEIEGLVTDDGEISFDGVSKIKPDKIMIDDVLLLNSSGKRGLFGLSVKGFCLKAPGKNPEAELLAVCEKTTVANVTTILGYNIDSFKNGRYYYTDELYSSTKLQQLKVSSNVDIVYNGGAVKLGDAFTDAMMIPQSGRVKAYDNDGNRTADVLLIDDLTPGIVKSVDTDNNKIYLNDAVCINLNDKDYIIKDATANKLELGSIKKDNTVSYGYSINNDIVKIIVSDIKVNDTVQSTFDENGMKGFSTDKGANYIAYNTVSSSFGELELGTVYNIYIDVFGVVAGYKKTASAGEMLSGCVMDSAYDNGLDAKYLFKMFTEYDEVAIYKAADRVKLIKADDTVGTYDESELGAEFGGYTGIVRFQLNADDEVKFIEIPHSAGSLPTEEDRLFTLLDTVETSLPTDFYVNVRNSAITIGGDAVVTNSTKVFRSSSIPSDENGYRMTSANSSFAQGGKYTMYVYGTDYKSKSAVYINMVDSGAADAITMESTYTVKNITRVYDENEGEAVYRLTMLDPSGTERIYNMKEYNFKNSVKSFGSANAAPVILSKGDTIVFSSYSKYGKEYINSAVCVYDMDWIVDDEQGNDVKGAIAGTNISYYSGTDTLCSPFSAGLFEAASSGNANSYKYYSSNVRVFVGWVYSYEDGFIQITNQNPKYGYRNDVDKDDGFITQIFNYEGRGITTEIAADGRVTSIKKTTDSDIRSYLDYGTDCTKVVHVQRVYDPRNFNFINAN